MKLIALLSLFGFASAQYGSSYEAPTYNAPETQESAEAPSSTYDAPTSTYDVPAPTYNAPEPSYEAPVPTYQEKAPTYDAPETPETYEAPASSYDAPAPSYNVPAASYEAPVPNYKAPETSYSIPSTPHSAPASTYNAPSSGYTPTAAQYGAPSGAYQPAQQYGAPVPQAPDTLYYGEVAAPQEAVATGTNVETLFPVLIAAGLAIIVTILFAPLPATVFAFKFDAIVTLFNAFFNELG